MDQLQAAIDFIRTSGFINVTCMTQYDPPRVQVDMPLGLQLTFGYKEYQEIREAAGLPDHVCTEGYTY